jgi:ABC-2 type transport system permease protein
MLRTEATIATLTIRQLLARRRGAAVLAFAALPLAIAALFRLNDAGDAAAFGLQLYDAFVIRIVLPVVALIFGTGAFGAKREEGNPLPLLTKPVPRWRVALVKLGIAMTLTTAVAATVALLTGLILFGGFGPDRLVAGFTAGVALGSVLYAGVFVALGLFVRRAILVGLAYVVIWEAVAADMFAGTRMLSIRQYVLSAADRIAQFDPGRFPVELAWDTARAMSGAVLVAAVLLAVYRLRSFEVIDQQ